MKNVSIIILTWNGLSYTRQCLTSLKDTLTPEVTVYVVDNGSTDGTLEYLDTIDWIWALCAAIMWRLNRLRTMILS